MGTVAERIQKQNIQILQTPHGLRRYFAEIGQVGGGTKTEPVNLRLAVDNFYRLEAGAKKFQRSIDVVHLYPCQAAIFIVRIENIPENILQGFRGLRVRIKRYLVRVAEAQGTHIIQAQDMVGMG